jgi:hypothetical protein
MGPIRPQADILSRSLNKKRVSLSGVPLACCGSFRRELDFFRYWKSTLSDESRAAFYTLNINKNN